MKAEYLIIFSLVLLDCRSAEDNPVSVVSSYLKTRKPDNESYQRFIDDSLKIWFEDKTGSPVIKIKGQNTKGPWAEWDEEFNSTSTYDSLWQGPDANTATGIFYETNEFFDLIGKPPTESIRTFRINSDGQIFEILIVWRPGQKTADEYLKPIVEWSLVNEPSLIAEIYKGGKINPSRENAKKWRMLISAYHKNHDRGSSP